MRHVEDPCVRCDVCHHCGNQRPYIYYTCAVCGDTADYGELYHYNNKDYCAHCLAAELLKEQVIESCETYYGDD